jgi:hypothetical protein
MIDDDPDTLRGLELMAEAQREHTRGETPEPEAAHTYQLDPNKTFAPHEKGTES